MKQFATILIACSLAGAFTNPPGTQWWASQTTGSEATFSAVSFGSRDTGWIVGEGGTILKSVNGGNAWVSQGIPSLGALHAVHAWNARIAMVSTSDGRVINTTDGGETWSFQSGNRGQALIGLQLAGANLGYALSPDSVFKTTNGGASWSGIGLGVSGSARAFHFPSATTGWVVGGNGRILKTTNGGAAWSVQTDTGIDDTLRAVHFINDNLGWIAGDSGLVRKTTDGGASWTTQATGSAAAFRAVRFANATTGWIAGSGIYKTTNGGASWIAQTADSMAIAGMPTSLHVFDTLTAIGAGNGVAKCPATLSLLSPNGGETHLSSHGVPIYWSGTNIPKISLAYSADNGATWTAFPSSSNGPPGYDVWAAQVPVGTQYKIRITRSGSHQRDESDGPFTIAALNITAPTFLGNWRSGSTQNITWNGSLLGPLMRLDYTLNNGNTWIPIADSVPTAAGTYAWTLPTGIRSGSANLRLTNRPDTTLKRQVIGFVIGGLYVVSPISGEVLYRGTTNNLTWSTTGGVGLINVQYSADDGSTWTTLSPLAGVNASNESFAWAIPATQPYTTQARLRLQDKADTNNIYAVNEYAFIVGGIALTSPNGGEIWNREIAHPITWTNLGETQTVTLQYSRNNGTTWTNIATSVPVSAKTYNWNIPAAARDTNAARIRIFDNARSTTVRDTSDGVFQITTLVSVNPSSNVSRFALFTGDPARLRFTLPAEAIVRLDAINAKGSFVATLVNETLNAGMHEVDLAGLPQGLYTYRLRAGNKEITRRAPLVR
jgi:photosystem II stability/assembly factor-like uncharacterized protein